MELRGVVPPVITPFKDEEPDLRTLKADLEIWNRFDLSGYLVLGSNGEGIFLDDAEKERVVAAAREMIPADRFMMVGTGQQSTRATVRFTRRAAELGADCALVISPFYFKGQMGPQQLKAHYDRVAEESPIPILVYNVPQNTGLNVPAETVAALAEHENVVGIKDSSGNIAQLSDIIRLTPDDFIVFTGSAPVLFPALCLGAVGGILAVANVAPQVCIDIYNLVAAGGLEKARKLQQDMTPLAKMVTQTWGVGGLKAAMALAGYPSCQARSPLAVPGDESVLEALKAELVKLALA